MIFEDYILVNNCILVSIKLLLNITINFLGIFKHIYYKMKFYRITLCMKIFSFLLILNIVSSQENGPTSVTAVDTVITCKANELFNGQVCTCAPGYVFYF